LRRNLTPEVTEGLRDTIANALHHVYIISFLLAVTMLLITLAPPRGLSAFRAGDASR
jgi:hypothetical protein